MNRTRSTDSSTVLHLQSQPFLPIDSLILSNLESPPTPLHTSEGQPTLRTDILNNSKITFLGYDPSMRSTSLFPFHIYKSPSSTLVEIVLQLDAQ
ncbi:unnamed protein product [Lactuca saligna]|uniref:Uncharacterized protein n=1 Tax=Lactuca saligna TaxID=75948 RepID=A0AA36ELU0_LACSI|nr:unnamed protein product [Lactuca saligna]